MTQIGGRRCSPAVTPATFPIVLGDIPVSGTASAAFTFDFTGCSDDAQFIVKAPWSSATYHTGTHVSFIAASKDHDGDHQR